jgi:hypothetical protein
MGWFNHAADQIFPKISLNAKDNTEVIQEFAFVAVSGRYGTIKSISLGCAVFTASRSMIGPGNRFNTLKYDLKRYVRCRIFREDGDSIRYVDTLAGHTNS